MDSINNACKLGSDAWLELQAFKTRQLNRREKLNRHKNLHKDLINGITSQSHQPQTQNHASSSSSSSTSNNNAVNPPIANQDLSSSRIAAHQKSSTSTSSPHNVNTASHELGDAGQSSSHINIGPGASITDATNRCGGVNKIDLHDTQPYTVGETSADTSASSNQLVTDQSVNLELVECLLLLKLCDVALKLPIDSKSLQRSICRIRALARTPLSLIENLLQKFAHQELITIEEPAPALANRQKTQPIRSADVQTDDEPCIYVTLADHTKLVEFDKSYSSREDIQALLVESKSDDLVNGDEQDSVPIQSIRSSSSSASSSHLHDKDDSSVKHKSDIHNDARQQRNSIETNVSETKSAYSSAKSKLDSTNSSKAKKIQAGDDLESLLSLSSTRERESKKLGEELLELLSKPTAKERNLLERFRSSDGYQVQEFCPKGTKGECIRNNNGGSHCDKLHFKKIIAKHTEESLGDCSFLNTCFHMDSCKYVHYEVDYGERIPQQNQFKRPAEPNQRRRDDHIDPTASTPTADKPTSSSAKDVTKSNAPQNMAVAAPGSSGPFLYKLSHEEQARIDAKNRKRFKTVLYPPQWIQCDLRFFDMSLLGKFSVVMADPPWDIHMELPYGTMSDEEMRKLNIPALQDEGVIFLWVTGRAMELGRECLALWGYERCDEIIWVKTNQLQRIIRTGRTGHWLNHGKEHCLVGVKGKPKDMNRGLDCDVIVAEVRATSHKPDEIYGIIERLSPGTRKIELFGRAHNVQPNWITLGNQLNGVRLIEQSLIGAFKKLNIPFQTADD